MIELLAPCGDLETLKVAVKAGCDAVYLSGKRFGARAYATNFSIEEIKEAVDYCHLRNVLVYVTVNTIIYDDEFSELASYIEELYKLSVDALIVQDLGVIHYVREKYPDFEIHASTQLNVSNVEGCRFLKSKGIKRIVLARETSIEEIKKITNENIEVEVFAHGALCFCASGNCLMSYQIGKRSANRGECAQPCRKKYFLEEDGNLKEFKSYLSMKDLMTIDRVNELIEANVSSLKIEGRMKSKEYVYQTVKSYRKAIDDYYKNIKTDVELDNLKVVFNRGFTKGYVFNEQNSLLTNVNHVNHQGLEIGKVCKVSNDYVDIKLSHDLDRLDSIRINSYIEVGKTIDKMYVLGCETEHASRGQIVRIFISSKAKVNDIVVKTQSRSIQKEVDSLNDLKPLKIKAFVNIEYNKPILIKLCCQDKIVSYEGKIIDEISNKPSFSEFIASKFTKFNKEFELEEFNFNYDGKSFISVKDINFARRCAIELLKEKIIKVDRVSYDYQIHEESFEKTFEIDVVCNSIKQYEIAKELGFNNIFTDYESDSMNNSRMIKSNHFGLIHNVCGLNDEFKNRISSVYFNVVNFYSVDFLRKSHISNIYLSNELSLEQSIELANKCNANLGIMVYGKYDLMVSKHCLIAKEKGHLTKKCFECKQHNYYLVDEFKNRMRLLCDKDCNMRIISYKPINYLSKLNEIKESFNRIMIVFTDEKADECKNILNMIKSIKF